jgi:protein O-mannosyl-transferase
LLPLGLCMIYPRWDVHTITPWGLLELAALPACAAVIFFLRRQRGVLAASLALGYYLLALAPTLGMVDMTYMIHSFVADHWQYLGLPGAIAVIISPLCSLAARRQASSLRLCGLLAAAAIIAPLIILSRAQAATYASSISLWQDTLKHNPTALAAHTNLAAALVEQGQYGEALAHYQRALALKPRQASTYNNIGLLYARQQKYEPAVENYRQALEIDPRYGDAHYDLALALAHLDQYAEAANEFKRSINDRFVEDPPAKLADRHEGLASCLVKLDRLEEALAQYEQALELVSGHPLAIENRQKAWHMLALKLAAAGKVDPAVTWIDRALAVAPSDGKLWLAKGEIFLAAGRIDEARACLLHLEQLQPGWAQKCFETAHQFETAGQAGPAIDAYRKAALAHPNYAAALNNLAWLLATTDDDALRDGKQAVTYARQAVAIASPAQKPKMQLCLSVALAEARQAPAAVEAARTAQELEKAAGHLDQARLLEELISAYQNGQTYRDLRRRGS